MTSYLQQRTLFPPQIHLRPSPNLGLIVVIPAYMENFLLLSLMSLKKCTRPACDVEVIVVVNDSERDEEEVKDNNFRIAEQAGKWASKNRLSWLRFHILHHRDLPKKHSGVGLARKIGMDEACWRFEKEGIQNGIIACFDADSRCEPNYFQAIWDHFQANPKSQACSIHFEHPLFGAEFEEEVYLAIAQYELHLRYYIQAQRLAGFPFAYQTIGSSMAVRSDGYQSQGGMNKRKAGEDFYFLHKFTTLGNFSELTNTKVIPSPRPSDRVPFGTGRAISSIVQSKDPLYTYAPDSFVALKKFFDCVPSLYEIQSQEFDILKKTWPKCIQQFLELSNFTEKLVELKSHTSQPTTFANRFFRWFNAFMVMKYLHFARDHFYPDVEVAVAAQWLLTQFNFPENSSLDNVRKLLAFYRKMDLQQV